MNAQPRLAYVKDVVLWLLYKRFIHSRMDDYVKGKDLLSELPPTIPVNLQRRAVEDCFSSGMLERHEVGTTIDRMSFRISTKGIEYCEQYEKWLRRNLQRITTVEPVDAWKIADSFGNLKESVAEEVRQVLREAIESIERAQLSQQDKADARQKIRSAQEMAEAPTPHWGVVYYIVKPFTNSFISEFAKRIVSLVFGSS